VSYDPFRRGDHLVGVRTLELEDMGRARHLVAEVWYPARGVPGLDLDRATQDRYALLPGFPESRQAAVRDAPPADGPFPLAIFSHGYAGHRRQSTFFTTHLASHGWVVVAIDHAGNTLVDMIARLGSSFGDAGQASLEARPRDIRFVIEAAAEGRLGAPPVDATRVGMTGHSFGGWTVIRVVADEPRIAAAVALAPAAGMPLLRATLDLTWRHPTPTLVIAADRDSIVPLTSIEALFPDLPPPKQLVVLENTDHMHFCDGARETHEMFRRMPIGFVQRPAVIPPFDELAPGSHGHDAARGLGLAHLDAFIRDDDAARTWIADPVEKLRQRGIPAH